MKAKFKKLTPVVPAAQQMRRLMNLMENTPEVPSMAGHITRKIPDAGGVIFDIIADYGNEISTAIVQGMNWELPVDFAQELSKHGITLDQAKNFERAFATKMIQTQGKYDFMEADPEDYEAYNEAQEHNNQLVWDWMGDALQSLGVKGGDHGGGCALSENESLQNYLIVLYTVEEGTPHDEEDGSFDDQNAGSVVREVFRVQANSPENAVDQVNSGNAQHDAKLSTTLFGEDDPYQRLQADAAKNKLTEIKLSWVGDFTGAFYKQI